MNDNVKNTTKMMKTMLMMIIQDFWRLLPSKSLTDRQLLADFTTRVNVFIIIVIIVITLSITRS